MARQFRSYLLLLVLSLPVLFRMATWGSPAAGPTDPVAAGKGRELFEHLWTPGDPLAAAGDGLGPVFNENSCVACHRQGGVGGSGSRENNVTTFTIRPLGPNQGARQGVVHAHAIDAIFQETLTNVHPALAAAVPIVPAVRAQTAATAMPGCDLRSIAFPPGVHVSQRKTPAVFGAKLIDGIPDRVIIAQERMQRVKWGLASSELESVPVGRALRTPQGKVGHFGWKAQTGTLLDFVQGACANELGLGNPGQAQPRSLAKPDYTPPGLDLTDEQCRQLTAFIEGLPRPIERLPQDAVQREYALAGKLMFSKIGCSDCHTPDLDSVTGIYSDLLVHRMGQGLEGGGSYNDPPLPIPDANPDEGPHPSEWRTPPLWGVANSAPYLHDGRANNLHEAIVGHGGQGAAAARKYQQAAQSEQAWLIAFLNTLQTP
jgi:CxxC motif-containing protein (DUF1111 family)